MIKEELSLASNRSYTTLDGMRGVAALAVVTLHLVTITTPVVAWTGSLAVDLFYVLSGFIVAHAYGTRLRSGMSFKTFMLIRLVRLYPLYALGTFIGVVELTGAWMTNHGRGTTLGAVFITTLKGFLFIPTLKVEGGGAIYPLNTPAWSLLFELVVNAIYALCAPWLSTRRLLAVVVVSLGLLVYSGWLASPLFGVELWSDIPGGLARAVLSFTAGLLVYRFHRVHIPFPPIILLSLSALILAFDTAGRHAELLRCLLIFPVMPILVTLGAINEPEPRLGVACRFLGKTSYAIYALHAPVFLLVSHLLKIRHIDLWRAAPWGGLVFIALIVVLAAYVDQFYDAPFRVSLTRRFGLNKRVIKVRWVP